MDYEMQHSGSSSANQSAIDDASMHTITASSLQNPQYEPRPQTSYSDTAFSRPYSHSADHTPEQMQNGNGLSRPPSTQSQSQYGQPQLAQKNASVVIKVGMVGDAQIGKTSLMVKYVEGSWDEDYIQTLGKNRDRHACCRCELIQLIRRQFHGKDHFHPQYRNNLFNLGSRRPKRVRQYAPVSLQ